MPHNNMQSTRVASGGQEDHGVTEVIAKQLFRHDYRINMMSLLLKFSHKSKGVQLK